GSAWRWRWPACCCCRSGTVCHPRQKSNLDDFAPSLGEPAAVRVTCPASQRHRFCKIHSDLADGMGVRSEGDGHACLRGQVDNLWAGINLPAIFAQTGCVQFHGDILFLRGFQEPAEQMSTVLVRIKTKLFAQ